MTQFGCNVFACRCWFNVVVQFQGDNDPEMTIAGAITSISRWCSKSSNSQFANHLTLGENLGPCCFLMLAIDFHLLIYKVMHLPLSLLTLFLNSLTFYSVLLNCLVFESKLTRVFWSLKQHAGVFVVVNCSFVMFERITYAETSNK